MVNLSNINSLTDINSMLQSAQEERGDLFDRRTFFSERIISSITNSGGFAGELAKAEQNIATATAELATLTPGTQDYLRQDARLKHAEGVKNNLLADSMSPGYTEVSRQQKQNEVDLVDVMLPVFDAYIALLEARKLELQGS